MKYKTEKHAQTTQYEVVPGVYTTADEYQVVVDGHLSDASEVKSLIEWLSNVALPTLEEDK